MTESTDGLGANRSGSTIAGKYDLVAVVGRGGMADVFLAATRGLMGFSKLVVIKQLRVTLSEDTDLVTMFADEARLAARLSHPNVVHTYEVGAERGTYYLVMEYLEGQHIRRAIRAPGSESAFTPPLVALVISEILAGLHYAHELTDFDGSPLNIVHRDVSPQNIFVTYDGEVKVVDFGIAKAELNATATAHGILKGKANYMAPEQVLGRPVDRRADIFSLGVVLWELLARSRLFPKDTGRAFHKVVSETVPRMATIGEHIPPELQRVGDRALRRNPNDRYATAAEMRADVDAYLTGLDKPPTRDDLAKAMLTLFAVEREELRQRINRFMAQPETRHAVDESVISARWLPSLGVGTGVTPLRPNSLEVSMGAAASNPSSLTARLSALTDSSSPMSGYVPQTLQSLQSRHLLTGGAALAVLLAVLSALLVRWRTVPQEPVGSVSGETPAEPPVGRVSVHLSTTPPGARVVYQDRDTGVTPVVFELSVGPHTLTLVKEGFVRKQYHLAVPKGHSGPLVVNTTLQREPQIAAGQMPEVAADTNPTRPSRRHDRLGGTMARESLPASPTAAPQASKPRQITVIADEKKPNITTIR
ncbi:protein kinase [Myxococcota bacterium]